MRLGPDPDRGPPIEYPCTRPSDLPLNVIVESGNSQAKVVLQMTPPLFGAKWKSPRSLSLTLMLNQFFSQNRAVFENLVAILILVNLSSLIPTKKEFLSKSE